jgi:hypothetical protein
VVKDSMDRLLEENCCINAYKLDGLGNINIPDLDKVIRDFRSASERSNNVVELPRLVERKTAAGPMRRFGLIAACTALILFFSTAVSVIMDTPKVQALRFSIIKTIIEMKGDLINITTTNKERDVQPISEPYIPPDNGNNSEFAKHKVVELISLEQIKTKISFPVIIPEYLPQGYVIKDVKWTRHIDGTNEIEQVYYDIKNNSPLMIVQVSNWRDINLTTITNSDNKVKEISVMGENGILILNGSSSINLTWFKNECKHDIIGSVSEQELLKIVQSLKYSSRQTPSN